MSPRVLFATIVAICIFFSACSDSTSETVSIEFDGPEKTESSANTVDFADSEVQSSSEAANNPLGEKPKDTTKVLPDKSEILTMYDGYGNVIETRTFKNNQNILSVVSKFTSDGRRETVVYGYNGERKVLPENLHDRVMSDRGSAVAAIAGITSTRQMRTVTVSRIPVTPTPGANALPTTQSSDPEVESNEQPLQNSEVNPPQTRPNENQ